MSPLKRLRAQASILVFLSIAVIDSARAEELDRRLLGAWAPSASECTQIFESRAGAPVFRQPVDTFTTAFIVGRREIRASTGSCRIGKVSSAAKGYMIISLSCDNSVGYLPLNARVKVIGADKITYGDSGVDPLLDAEYKKCAP
jgi:hypothetical protein